jgi:hypothetical protein
LHNLRTSQISLSIHPEFIAACYFGGIQARWSSNLEEYAVKETMIPKFDYYLDESDPDIVVLRRQDGAFVAAFSSQGATKEGICEAAEKDYLRATQEIAQARVEVYNRRGAF